MCERAVAQKALLRTRGQTDLRSWKFDSAGAVAITGILGEQCNQVDNSVPGRRGEERERQTKNRDESSRHRSLSLSRHHWVGLGVLWERSFGAGRLFLTLIKPYPHLSSQ